MKAVKRALKATAASPSRVSRRAVLPAAAAAGAAAAAPAKPAAAAAAAPATLPLTHEARVWGAEPLALVCGVDEAGRGPLAGPVVAAACIVLPEACMPQAPPLPAGVRDSKAVDEAAREALFPELLRSPRLVFGVSVLDHAAIDRVNILAASMLAMERATAAARAAAAARLALPPLLLQQPGAAAAAGLLPREDAIDFAGAGVAQPPPLRAPPAGLHPLAAIHTIFVDGPHCPARLAAATDGEAYSRSASASASPPAAAAAAAGKKRGRKALEEEPPAPASAPPDAAAAPGRRPATTLEPALEALLQGRVGPIHTACPMIKGDSRVYCIAAASLVAKVTRDRLMRLYDAQWPAYGFRDHKGYGSSAHMAAIAKHGASPIHRLTFAPLKHMYPAAAAAAMGARAVVEAAGAPAAARKKAKR